MCLSCSADKPLEQVQLSSGYTLCPYASKRQRLNAREMQDIQSADEKPFFASGHAHAGFRKFHFFQPL
jgi:hypothetical protein